MFKFARPRFFLSFLCCLLLLAGCGSNSASGPASSPGASSGPVELKLVSFLALDHPFPKDMIPLWKEKVEKELNGAVTIRVVGGPESLPVGDQFDAVRNGVVDIGFNVSSYYGHLMPESHSLNLSPFTPAEERENGYFDYMSDRFKQNNLVYLGRWLSESPYYFWTNKKIQALDELKSSKFRSNSTYHEVMLALDMVPMEVNPGDVYTSLERKMVDGFGFPLLGPRLNGWTEVTKYLIDEPFLNQNATILMNVKSFESLSPENQQKLLALTKDFETEMVEYFKKENEKEKQTLQEKGVELIKLSSEDSKKFQEIVKREKWGVLEKAVPDQVDELKKLLKYNP